MAGASIRLSALSGVRRLSIGKAGPYLGAFKPQASKARFLAVDSSLGTTLNALGSVRRESLALASM